MSAHPFQRTLRKRIRRIRKHAGALSRVCRHKGLHALRIELKRFRAMLRLFRDVDPKFPYPEVNQPFKTLFDKAGEVRFWQLQIRLLGETPDVPALFADRYRVYARKRLRHANEAFRVAVRSENLPRWRDVKDSFRLSLKRCKPGALGAYFKTTRAFAAGIAGHLEKTRSVERHELRKTLKDYALNRQLVSKHFKYDPVAMPGLPADTSLLDVPFGLWHDLQAAGIQLTDDLRTQKWEKEVLEGGAFVLRSWKKQEKAMWRRVYPLLKGIG